MLKTKVLQVRNVVEATGRREKIPQIYKRLMRIDGTISSKKSQKIWDSN